MDFASPVGKGLVKRVHFIASGRTCIKISVSMLFNVSVTAAIGGGMAPRIVELIKVGFSTPKNSFRWTWSLSLMALICALVFRNYH